jgi:hypothetical protein
MIIANPIYDKVFKYMMDDSKVACKFISTIIGENVAQLQCASQESVEKNDKTPIDTTDVAGKIDPLFAQTYYRQDFVAKIALANGSNKTVIIEIQRVSQPTDIERFRQYLGVQYMKKDTKSKTKTKTKTKSKASVKEKRVNQIYCIYFFGESVGIDDVAVLSVDKVVRNVTTGETIEVKNDFIEALHHKTWIVQVPYIENLRRRNELEMLLTIFDQRNTTLNERMLDLKKDLPVGLRPITRRLQRAVSDEEVQRGMDFEEQYIENIRVREQQIAEKKDKIIAKTKTVIAAKDKQLAVQAQQLAAQATALAEKDQQLAAERAQAAAELASLRALLSKKT